MVLTVFSSIQNSYERSGKVVKDEKEAELWSEVSQETMSDERRCKETDMCAINHIFGLDL